MEKIKKIWYNAHGLTKTKRNSNRMSVKKKKIFLILTESTLMFLIFLSLIFPSSVVSAVAGNTDTEEIELVNSITNHREIELFISNLGENVKGIMLYFRITGEREQGKIICDIYQNGKKAESKEIELKELDSPDNDGKLEGSKILFSTEEEELKDNIQIILHGSEILSNTRVSLYGNSCTDTSIKAMSKGIYYNESPLYQILTEKKEYRYTWECLLLFVFFNTVVFLKKENRVDEANI